MNNCENPSSKPRTVHLRFVTEKKKKKERKRSRFVILRAEDAKGVRRLSTPLSTSRGLFSRRDSLRELHERNSSRERPTAESPENRTAMRVIAIRGLLLRRQSQILRLLQFTATLCTSVFRISLTARTNDPFLPSYPFSSSFRPLGMELFPSPLSRTTVVVGTTVGTRRSYLTDDPRDVFVTRKSQSPCFRQTAVRYHARIHFRLAAMGGKASLQGSGDRRRSPPLTNDDAAESYDDEESAIDAAADSLVVLHACPPDHQGRWGDCRRIGASKTKDTQNSDISAPPVFIT